MMENELENKLVTLLLTLNQKDARPLSKTKFNRLLGPRRYCSDYEADVMKTLRGGTPLYIDKTMLGVTTAHNGIRNTERVIWALREADLYVGQEYQITLREKSGWSWDAGWKELYIEDKAPLRFYLFKEDTTNMRAKIDTAIESVKRIPDKVDLKGSWSKPKEQYA